MKPANIGIASQETIRARALSIARGERKPAPDEPKIWFTSVDSLAETMTGENRALAELIAGPQAKHD